MCSWEDRTNWQLTSFAASVELLLEDKVWSCHWRRDHWTSKNHSDLQAASRIFLVSFSLSSHWQKGITTLRYLYKTCSLYDLLNMPFSPPCSLSPHEWCHFLGTSLTTSPDTMPSCPVSPYCNLETLLGSQWASRSKCLAVRPQTLRKKFNPFKTD